jgi:hypothetical protein
LAICSQQAETRVVLKAQSIAHVSSRSIPIAHFISRHEMDRTQGPMVNFRLLYLATQMVGFSVVVLIIGWVGIHLKGPSWDYDDVSRLFNWHPILMTLGMVFLYGNCEYFF